MRSGKSGFSRLIFNCEVIVIFPFKLRIQANFWFIVIWDKLLTKFPRFLPWIFLQFNFSAVFFFIILNNKSRFQLSYSNHVSWNIFSNFQPFHLAKLDNKIFPQIISPSKWFNSFHMIRKYCDFYLFPTAFYFFAVRSNNHTIIFSS